MHIINIHQVYCTNDFFELEDKHYVTIFILGDYISGKPQVLEPDKCESWCWFSWHAMPQPLFLPIQNLVNSGFTINI